MQRDQSLIPLSQQHHDALALCVYIERAEKTGHLDLAHWNREVLAAWQSEIRWHFQAEEEVVFPAAQRFESLRPLVAELLAEHAELRRAFAGAEAGQLTASDLLRFRQTLTAHVRKEERQLFEQMQGEIPAAGLAAIGRELDEFFQRHTGGLACAIRHPQPQSHT
ncbi:MAG TPA: hemerythrin domain-containing protein [Terriglobales bacterium]|nr:hemerythrin domain-containing protein [Terriglobales bacterium]